jgi:predicted dehydrogenase
MNRPHNILVVGCGSIGERHLRCFQRTGRANLTGCDLSAAIRERLAATYQVPMIAGCDDAISSGAHDIVVICTPAPAHVPIARQTLSAGMHVLIEKPLSHSLDGVDQLIAEAAAGNRKTAVAYVYHQFPFLTQARDYLASADLGPVLQATYVGGQPFHVLRPGYAKTYYRDRKQGGGAIQDALTHVANWMESVLGPIETVYCDCEHLSLPEVDVEDTVHVTARHRGGALVSLAMNQFQAVHESCIRFHTARGSVAIEPHRQRWGVYKSGDREWTWHMAPVPERDTHFLAQANAFLDLIEGQPNRLCSLEAAAQTLRFNLAALESSVRRMPVSCSSVTPSPCPLPSTSN